MSALYKSPRAWHAILQFEFSRFELVLPLLPLCWARLYFTASVDRQFFIWQVSKANQPIITSLNSLPDYFSEILFGARKCTIRCKKPSSLEGPMLFTAWPARHEQSSQAKTLRSPGKTPQEAFEGLKKSFRTSFESL